MEKQSLVESLSVISRSSRRCLGVFVKEPVAGQVKTRLCPPLTPAEAANLYGVAVQETVDRFAAGSIPVVLFYSGRRRYFRERYPALFGLPQPDGDLGRRLTDAMALLFDAGFSEIAMIGSDSPDLPIKAVETAFALLDRHDAVTIPAADGGYVLIGSRRPVPQLLQAIPWSTGDVGAVTRQRAAEHGIRYCESGGWEDIDDLASLRSLIRRSPDSATARYARAHLRSRVEA